MKNIQPLYNESEVAEKSAGTKGYNVLYVDDEIINLRIFKMAFNRTYNVFTAENGNEALKILNVEDIHLIITDQKMPGMSGTELLQKTIDDHPDIIRIILTGFADIEAIVQAVNKCKIYKYITKPYDQDDMMLVLSKALELYQVKRERESLIDELAKINRDLELKVKERTRELEESNKRLTDGLLYAQTIQEFLIPKEREVVNAFGEAFVIYRPKDFVGGDFYWLKRIEKDDNVITMLAVVDSMGHGVAGALLSMIGETQLNEITKGKRILRAETILNKLDEKLRSSLSRSTIHEHNATMDSTLISVDSKRHKVDFCGAKLDLIYIKDGQLHRIKGTRKSIGSTWNEDMQFKRHTVSLEGVSAMYLFTDGLQDQFNGENTKKFGSKRLYELISSCHSKDVTRQKEHISDALDEWQKGSEQVDDITLIGIKF